MMRFNPTVVRLKDVLRDLRQAALPQFQSHCGAIKSRGVHPRLRAPNPVSIPLWCD